MTPISLVNAFNYYKKLPHQVEAIKILENLIKLKYPELLEPTQEWVKVWRNPPKRQGEIDIVVKAFLDLIAYCEGTFNDKGYNTIFTYAYFDSFVDHPRQLKCAGSLCSDASGRYQFLSTTWDDVATRLGLKDFSPHSQDLGAIQLLKDCMAYHHVVNGQISNAIIKSASVWASLPYSPYGQPTKDTLPNLINWYWDRVSELDSF